MNLLGEGGVRILLAQIVVGTAVYLIPGGQEMGIGPSLFSAGVVAAAFMVFAIIRNDMVDAALALSSLAAVATLFCVFGFLFGFATITGLICLAAAFIAAMVVKYQGFGGTKTTSELFFDALPVVGALRYHPDR